MTPTGQYDPKQPARSDIDKLPGALVLEFGTQWCGYCQTAQPIIDRAFEQYPTIRHIKIEDGVGRALGRSFAVRLWPSLLFLRDGNEYGRLVRPTDTAAVLRCLNEIDDQTQ